MRILIITHSYFPALTPRAFRWTAIAEFLVAHGHQVDVVCAKGYNQSGLEVVNEVNIHRVGGNFREVLKRCIGSESSKTGDTSEAKRAPSHSIRGFFGDVLKAINGYTFRKVMWPDYAGFWYFPALKKARMLLDQEQHEVVVSVSLPFTGHMVGLALKRHYAVRWVVDIGDPFAFMSETPVNNNRFFGRMNYRAELNVLKNADCVSVTTDGTRAEYLRYFPDISASKISVIPPLFVAPAEVDKLVPFYLGPPKIRLIFAGTLYSKIRNPATLLELFNSLLATPVGSQLELHFLGAINDCESYFEKFRGLIGTKIFLHGLVSRATAVRAMKDATILVNLGNTTAYQLPSKVVEYAMLGRPVLNIIKLASDSSKNFFFDFEGICTVSEQALSESAAEFVRVKEFVENPPHISQAVVDRLTGIYGLEAISKSYIKIFQDI